MTTIIAQISKFGAMLLCGMLPEPYKRGVASLELFVKQQGFKVVNELFIHFPTQHHHVLLDHLFERLNADETFRRLSTEEKMQVFEQIILIFAPYILNENSFFDCIHTFFASNLEFFQNNRKALMGMATLINERVLSSLPDDTSAEFRRDLDLAYERTLETLEKPLEEDE